MFHNRSGQNRLYKCIDILSIWTMWQQQLILKWVQNNYAEMILENQILRVHVYLCQVENRWFCIPHWYKFRKYYQQYGSKCLDNIKIHIHVMLLSFNQTLRYKFGKSLKSSSGSIWNREWLIYIFCKSRHTLVFTLQHFCMIF